MKRWLILILMLLLPFTWSYVAAGEYCQHETGAAAAHFGHHEHQHHDQEGSSADKTSKKDASSKHADCGACQQAPAKALPQQAAVLPMDVGSTILPDNLFILPDPALAHPLRPPMHRSSLLG